MPAELWFYHLEGARSEEILPDLLQKTLDRGWRAAVRAPDAEAAERIDAALWTAGDASFIPHGRAGPDDETAKRQPIWISTDDRAPNGADFLIAVDGAPLEAKRAAEFRRAAYLFDARDEAARTAARELWKSASDQGLETTYWTRASGGGWSKSG
ncbi:MAG: DNA polymerase III subunit chi [Pseudomonadota bacterium]